MKPTADWKRVCGERRKPEWSGRSLKRLGGCCFGRPLKRFFRKALLAVWSEKPGGPLKAFKTRPCEVPGRFLKGPIFVYIKGPEKEGGADHAQGQAGLQRDCALPPPGQNVPGLPSRKPREGSGRTFHDEAGARRGAAIRVPRGDSEDRGRSLGTRW